MHFSIDNVRTEYYIYIIEKQAKFFVIMQLKGVMKMDDIDFEDAVADNRENARADSKFLLDEAREKERIRRQINAEDGVIHSEKYFEDRGL